MNSQPTSSYNFAPIQQLSVVCFSPQKNSMFIETCHVTGHACSGAGKKKKKKTNKRGSVLSAAVNGKLELERTPRDSQRLLVLS